MENNESKILSPEDWMRKTFPIEECPNAYGKDQYPIWETSDLISYAEYYHQKKMKEIHNDNIDKTEI